MSALCLCYCILHVTLSVSVTSFFFFECVRVCVRVCVGGGGRLVIMTSFKCNHSCTYVLRVIILNVTEKKKKARSDTNCLSYIPSEKKNKIGISGCSRLHNIELCVWRQNIYIM